jgi:hypothetical protein
MAKAAEEVHQLHLQKVALDSELKEKYVKLEAMSSCLESITEKITKASEQLVEYTKQLKRKKVLVQYYNKKWNDDCLTSDTDEVATLCHAIEKAFLCLKGKHASTKAKILFEAIISGKLLQGEASLLVHDVTRQYIKQLFFTWKLVKAGDVSSVGGFKTTTINTLRTVIDENGEGLFPSPTTVARSRALLDAYGEKVVSFFWRDTKYGEV